MDLSKATSLLTLLNSLIPVGMQLGTVLVGLTKDAIAEGTSDPATVEEAQHAMAAFNLAIADTKGYIAHYLTTHPPTV